MAGRIHEFSVNYESSSSEWIIRPKPVKAIKGYMQWEWRIINPNGALQKNRQHRKGYSNIAIMQADKRKRWDGEVHGLVE